MYRILRPTDLSYNRRFIIYNICCHIPCIIYLILGSVYDNWGISDLKTCFAKKGSEIEATFVIPFAIYFPMHVVTMAIAIVKAENDDQKEFLKRYLAFIIVY